MDGGEETDERKVLQCGCNSILRFSINFAPVCLSNVELPDLRTEGCEDSQARNKKELVFKVYRKRLLLSQQDR